MSHRITGGTSCLAKKLPRQGAIRIGTIERLIELFKEMDILETPLFAKSAASLQQEK